MSLKQRIIDQGKALQAKKVSLQQQRALEIAHLDSQITAAQTLVANWDTATFDTMVPLLREAGLKVEVL
jgi:hypothetical protein